MYLIFFTNSLLKIILHLHRSFFKFIVHAPDPHTMI